MAHKKRGPINPRFRVGDKVRVKPGVSDPDFPDMPLGGWTGTVTEIIEHEGQINCVFDLDERTLTGIHPIYKQRCEIDGLDYGVMGLSQEEIEPDDGTPVPIEQPTAIVPRPLSPNDQDDRVRMALGLTRDDPVPNVSAETLMTYYRYLAANLTFPFFTSRWTKSGPFTRKKVIVPIGSLEPPVAEEFDEECPLYGIGIDQGEEIEIPLEVIELKNNDPNYRLISDYTYWSNSWRRI